MISKHKCIIFHFTNLLYKMPLDKECKTYFQVRWFSEALEETPQQKKPTTNQPKTNLLYCSIDKTLKDEREALIHCSYSKTSWSNGRIGEAVGELGRSPMTNPWPWGEEHMGWRAPGALAAGRGGCRASLQFGLWGRPILHALITHLVSTQAGDLVWYEDLTPSASF